jgi:DNA segregation ATPase FtsK/SpoIIIE and related proteins
MEEQIQKAKEIVKQYPNNIGVSLLQRYLRVGVIRSNKILEALENNGVISKSNDGKRKLLI